MWSWRIFLERFGGQLPAQRHIHVKTKGPFARLFVLYFAIISPYSLFSRSWCVRFAFAINSLYFFCCACQRCSHGPPFLQGPRFLHMYRCGCFTTLYFPFITRELCGIISRAGLFGRRVVLLFRGDWSRWSTVVVVWQAARFLFYLNVLQLYLISVTRLLLPQGTFLLRDQSSTLSGLILSYVTASESIEHCLIYR